MKWMRWVALAGLVGLVAYGAKDKVDPDGSAFPRVFGKGIYVGGEKATSTNLNRLGHYASCVVNYDFGAIIPVAGYHEFTPSYTCTGVKLGDACSVGVLAATPADGGSAWEEQMDFRAIAKSNDRIVIMAISASGDGGAMNPPDAGYQVACMGNALVP